MFSVACALARPLAAVHRRVADRLWHTGWVVVGITAPFGDPDRLRSAVQSHQFLQRAKFFLERLRRNARVIHVQVEHVDKAQAAVLDELA